MENTDVLIIGGGPGGIVAALTARKYNPDKKITLVRDKLKNIVPCGIPYVFNRLKSVDENLISDDGLKKNKIDLVINKAVKLDTNQKTISLDDGNTLIYEKLVLATGSRPTQIPIKGVDKRGVWIIKKDYDYLKKLREAVLSSKNIVIIGGGFIGVELAEELSNVKGLNISLVEKQDHCLATTFDEEFCTAAEGKLIEKNVKLFTGVTTLEIGGGGEVSYVELSNGEKIDADLVILSIGSKPNTELTQNTEIKLSEHGGITVDEYMKTNVNDIFAIGDCAETADFFTGKYKRSMLASTASMEARLVGANLYQLKILRENGGSLDTFATYVDGMVLASAGLTEKMAKDEGFEVISTHAECASHHPKNLPNTKPVILKLIFSKSSGVLLGGQVMGPENISELINTISLAIQQKNTAYDLTSLQVSTHPLLTPAPTVSPIITAAQNALGNLG